MSEPHVPHVLEGALFSFGDTLVKAGKVDAALAVYRTLTQTKGFSTWSYRDEVTARLSSDLRARAAQYATGTDPRTQPTIGAKNGPCLQCHQR